MEFTISSKNLYNVLQNNQKVVPTKATMPILDYFLFSLKDSTLTITSSDLETTLISKLQVITSGHDGKVAVPSKLIIDSLRELYEQPITFEVSENNTIKISWMTGQLMIPGMDASGYPTISDVIENSNTINISIDWLNAAISKTVFATTDNELRPIMNGIYFDLTPERSTFVATDAHKLVRLINNNANETITEPCSFILPKKPALLLKNIIVKHADDVTITFNNKNIMFELEDYCLICRSIEGRYPNYNSVIPQHNNNKVLIDRVVLLNSLKRVSVCSSQASNLIKFTFKDDKLDLVAQDTDFSISAEDSIDCQYNGVPLAMGFKSTFTIEMLQNMSTEMVSLEFSEATRAGLIVPYEPKDELEQNLLMLLMPIMS